MLPLTVIICTYRREQAVRETLATLFGPEVQSTAAVDLRVIVVDQARTLDRDLLPPEWNVRIVHQDNFGGAGGFTRGMIEAMDEGAGWLLLMDDDSKPDPSSFPFLAQYILQRAPETRFALHGAMFSTEEPDTVFEAGARIKQPASSNFDIVQRLRGHKPQRPLERDPKMSTDMEVDYGAWWFFCVHSQTVAEAGLPLPLFIRGDDCEYGLRLKSKGIPTLALPGLRIWHPVHSTRLDRWYVLFDWRNKFVCKALHGPASRVGLTITFWKRVFYRLLAAEYDLAELMLAGLQEYLKGPGTLEQKPEALLAKARCLARLHVTFENTAPGNSYQILTKVTRCRALRRIVQTLLLNGLFLPARAQARSLPVFHGDGPDWLRLFRVPVYGVVSEDHQLLRLHRRSFRIFAKLLLRSTNLTMRYLFAFHSLASRWREQSAAFHSAATWQRYLAKATPASPQPTDLSASRQVTPCFAASVGCKS
jgi:galactofuranosylgalactofuranosylrhamnosyl-N-acetylglucosaminyl-diphospho-decaprenol beta-1,5/1,6-galactofuranosyltransferase